MQCECLYRVSNMLERPSASVPKLPAKELWKNKLQVAHLRFRGCSPHTMPLANLSCDVTLHNISVFQYALGHPGSFFSAKVFPLHPECQLLLLPRRCTLHTNIHIYNLVVQHPSLPHTVAVSVHKLAKGILKLSLPKGRQQIEDRGRWTDRQGRQIAWQAGRAQMQCRMLTARGGAPGSDQSGTDLWSIQNTWSAPFLQCPNQIHTLSGCRDWACKQSVHLLASGLQHPAINALMFQWSMHAPKGAQSPTMECRCKVRHPFARPQPPQG